MTNSRSKSNKNYKKLLERNLSQKRKLNQEHLELRQSHQKLERKAANATRSKVQKYIDRLHGFQGHDRKGPLRLSKPQEEKAHQYEISLINQHLIEHHPGERDALWQRQAQITNENNWLDAERLSHIRNLKARDSSRTSKSRVTKSGLMSVKPSASRKTETQIHTPKSRRPLHTISEMHEESSPGPKQEDGIIGGKKNKTKRRTKKRH
jgi:hypothetical protein